MTTGGLSTPFAGFCAPAILGAICRPDYGDWKNTHRRFVAAGGTEVCGPDLLEEVMDDPDFEWLMIDASYIKAQPHSAGARGGNQATTPTKGG